MVQSVVTDGPKTFLTGEALEAYRRVKVKSGTTTSPPEVVYADAGEAYIGVTLYPAASGYEIAVQGFAKDGTIFVEAADSFAVGADLYGAADGKVSDTANGTAYLKALEAATAGGDVVEAAVHPFAATAAGSISVTDAGSIITGATVEAALAEAFTHIQTAQKLIQIPLSSLTQEDGTALTKFADGDSATPGFAQISNKEVVLRWNNHATPTKVAAFGIALPPDLAAGADVVVHWRAKMSGATDSPDIEHEAYLGAGDTDCAGTDDEVDQGTTLTEYTATIGNADVGGSPEELTLLFGPKATELGTDDLLVYSVWIEYTGKTLTA